MTNIQRVATGSALIAVIGVLGSWGFYRAGAKPDSPVFPVGLFAEAFEKKFLGKNYELSESIPLAGVRELSVDLGATDLSITVDPGLTDEAQLEFSGSSIDPKPLQIEKSGDTVRATLSRDSVGLQVQFGSFQWTGEREARLRLPARGGVQLKVVTGSGDVSGELPQGARIELVSGSGDVALKLGRVSEGAARVQTGSGDVALFVKPALKPALELRSGSGEIALEGKWDVTRDETGAVRSLPDAKAPAKRLAVEVQTGSGEILLKHGDE